MFLSVIYLRFIITLVKGMFDLQIDKKKKKTSSMNKSCEKKQQQHILKIFYMWMFCITLKGGNTQRFVQNWCDRVYFTIVIVLFHNYVFSN